jgi:hypothetical protein
MTPEQIQILDDVDERIRGGCLIPSIGRYACIEQSPKGKITCEACALGSLFLGLVDTHKQGTLREWELTGHSRMREDLSKYFSKRTIILIECAFETNDRPFGSTDEAFVRDYTAIAPEELREKAAEFGRKYTSDGRRLRAILNNIRKNDGEFIP